MADERNGVPSGPGRLLGALSLACFAVTVVLVLVATALASESFAAAGDAAEGGGLHFAIKGGLIVLAFIAVAAGTCLLGVVFGLAGVVLARSHPHGKVLWPTLGLAVNGLSLLGASLFYLYLVNQ